MCPLVPPRSGFQIATTMSDSQCRANISTRTATRPLCGESQGARWGFGRGFYDLNFRVTSGEVMARKLLTFISIVVKPTTS